MSFGKTVQLAASVVGLISAIVVGFGYINNTYASKAELKAQVGDLRQQLLYAERRTLAREKYQLEIKMEKGQKLTDKEREQYKYLNDEIIFIDRSLKGLQRQ